MTTSKKLKKIQVANTIAVLSFMYVLICTLCWKMNLNNKEIGKWSKTSQRWAPRAFRSS